MDRLTDLFLDGDINKEAYGEKHKELTRKHADITKEIENHEIADDKLEETLTTLVELTSKSLNAFKASTVSEKHKYAKSFICKP